MHEDDLLDLFNHVADHLVSALYDLDSATPSDGGASGEAASAEVKDALGYLRQLQELASAERIRKSS